jgi:hypothetical protein
MQEKGKNKKIISHTMTLRADALEQHTRNSTNAGSSPCGVARLLSHNDLLHHDHGDYGDVVCCDRPTRTRLTFFITTMVVMVIMVMLCAAIVQGRD